MNKDVMRAVGSLLISKSNWLESGSIHPRITYRQRKVMIHYHGTPITPNHKFDTMVGKHFCVSYVSPYQLERCLTVGQSVMFDNGAFSCKTRGLKFDLHGFYEWAEKHLSHPHWAVVPDVIDGSEEQQREMVKTWPFRKEFGIPVWHLGMPIDYLLELGETWGRVCFGSSGEYWNIGNTKWCGRMDEAFNALTKTFGSKIPWIHGLRMLGQSSGPWPLASADSTNVAVNHHINNRCPNCMATRIDSTNPPSLWTERLIQEEIL